MEPHLNPEQAYTNQLCCRNIFFQNMCLYFSSLFFSIVLTWQVVQLLHTTDMSPHLRISGMSIVEAS